jgi:hypothetical protein
VRREEAQVLEGVGLDARLCWYGRSVNPLVDAANEPPELLLVHGGERLVRRPAPKRGGEVEQRVRHFPDDVEAGLWVEAD